MHNHDQTLCLMISMKSWIGILLFIFLASPLHAQWMTVQGNASIVDGEIAPAREEAVQDALRQALLQAGASVSSIQAMSHGSLTKDQFQIRANGEIRRYQLVEERRTRTHMQVTVRAYVVADRSRCTGGSYAKGITLIRIRLTHPEQTSYGQLFDFNKELTRQLFGRLSQLRQNFVTQRWLDANLNINPRRLSQGEKGYMGQLQSLAKDTDSQYLLFGELEDISLRDSGSNLVTRWMNDPIRHFTLQLYLFDGLTGELVDQPRYDSEASWEFDTRDQVDVASQRFWKSAYGQEVSHLLDRAIQDLQLKLQCTNPIARILRVDGDQFHINLGKRNGIKIGERFHIEQKASYTDESGQERTVRNPTLGEMEVRKVYENNAIMSPLRGYAPGNIQINDLAVLE